MRRIFFGTAAIALLAACSAAESGLSAGEGTQVQGAALAHTEGARKSGGPRPMAAAAADGGTCATQMHVGTPGLVIPTAVVSQVYWGSYWSGAGASERTGYDAAWNDVANNPYFYQRLAEYSTPTQTIRTGSWTGSALANASLASGTTITEAQIQAELQAEITAGTVPPRTSSHIYVIMLPPGVTSQFDQTNSFAGHHRFFNDASNNPVYYAVITYNSDPNYNNPLISHEISEAITDPDLSTGWIDTATGDEIGDICRFNYATLDGYQIEKIFSQQQCACVGAGPAQPPPVITNGDFEQPTLSGWTTTGTTGPGSPGHSGQQAALLGARSATNGDSTIAQTFTAPTNGGTLSFWYLVQCNDTVQYDWATATLKDVTLGTTSTVLAKTCTNNATWSKVSASLVGGHSYTLTLVNHDDNYAGDPTDTFYDDVVVDAATQPPPGGIVNGGFESGDMTGWTAAASSSIAAGSSTAHTGNDAVLLGLFGKPTNGDSSVTQTFTAPAGVTTLSFWYHVICKDTVQYDWATASLKDNTSGTTTTPLAKTCSNSGTWKQVSVAVTAGHSYTLKLVNHDDNYSGDETYTYWDDVALK